MYGIVYVVIAFRLVYGATLLQSMVRSAGVLLLYSVVVGGVAIGIAFALIFGRPA